MLREITAVLSVFAPVIVVCVMWLVLEAAAGKEQGMSRYWRKVEGITERPLLGRSEDSMVSPHIRRLIGGNCDRCGAWEWRIGYYVWENIWHEYLVVMNVCRKCELEVTPSQKYKALQMERDDFGGYQV